MGCTATTANYRSRSISFVRAIGGVVDGRITVESVFSSKINIPARCEAVPELFKTNPSFVKNLKYHEVPSKAPKLLVQDLIRQFRC
jgi:hypothetical protein